MIAFAGNSLLCRVALKHTAIDPANHWFVNSAHQLFPIGYM